MKKVLPLLLVLIASLGFSQQKLQVLPHLSSVNHDWDCGQSGVMESLFTSNPELKEDFELGLRKIEKNLAKQKDGLKDDSTVYTIPVVFHILHNGEAEGTGSNISLARIESAIEGMNRDFRRTAADGGIAQGAGPDMFIEFCLAGRDPNGDPHSGVNRIDASSVAGYSADGITEDVNGDELKNLSKWPTTDYVNVWVVREIEGQGDHTDWAGGTLGYAYLPIGNPSFNPRDGIVSVYFATGNDIGSSDPTLIFKKNRTLTHEMGHHLGLYHPFQDDSCIEVDCTTEGDRVCDTPPTTLNSNCNSPACSGTQLVENYMDYTGENCVDMFTQGQKDRMRAVLEAGGQRNSLLSSNGCDPNAITADFVADQTNIPFGTTVNFTDLSSSAVPANDWAWDFGDGNTSTLQNPSNTYNSIGNYTVKLVVSNGADTDSIIKESYIQVVAPPGFCDTLSNVSADPTFTIYTLQGGWGYYPGHNYLEIPQYAEEFFVAGATNLTSAAIPFRSVDNLSGTGTVKVSVLSDDGSGTGLPGAELAFEVVNISDLVENQYNLIGFNPPVPVNGKFHVAYEVYYGNPQDTVSVYVENQASNAENTLSALVNGTWMETYDIFGGSINVSSGILAITSQGEATADIIASNTSICPGDAVQFDGSNSADAESYQWVFEGGDITLSNELQEEVTYANGGSFKAYLYAFRCGSPAVDSVTIEVFDPESIEFETTDPSTCLSTDGKIVVSNPGTYTYTWQVDPVVVEDSLTDIAEGLYYVEISNGSCTALDSVLVSYSTPSYDLTLLADDTCSTGEGIAYATVNGAGNYNFFWNEEVVASMDTLSTATSGYNYIRITDADDCEIADDSILVSSMGQFPDSVNVSTVDASCGNDGRITMDIFPASPESDAWETVLMNNGDTVPLPYSNLRGGDYILTVSNNICDSDEGTYTLAGFDGVVPPYTMELLSGDSCSQQNGAAAIVIDSIGSFTYFWNEMAASDTIQDVLGGSYYVVSVYNDQPCEFIMDSIFIPAVGFAPDSIVENLTHTVCGEPNGMLSYTVYPESVVWDVKLFEQSGGAQLGEPFDNMNPGLYDFVVTDGTCGPYTTVYEIEDSPELAIDPTVLEDTVYLNEGGIAEFFGNITGENYSINWDFGDGFGTSDADNPSYGYSEIGTYTVTVVIQDVFGCVRDGSVTVVVEQGIGIAEQHVAVSRIYPNPAKESVFVESNARLISAEIVNYLGQKQTVPFTTNTVDVSQFPMGQYLITLVFDNGVVDHHKIQVVK